MNDRRPLGTTLIIAAALAAFAVMTLTGCSAEPIVPAEGEVTCAGCHTDRDMLRADLEADPLTEKVAAESEGEG